MESGCVLITPLKNERSSVSELWQAIQNQSVFPDEWFIVDNGSDDGTYEWLIARRDEAPFRVGVFSMPGLTIAQMMNAAIRLSTCDTIACCHGGTEIPVRWLENLLRPLMISKDIAVSAGVWKGVGRTRVERWLARWLTLDLNRLDENRYLPASRSLAFRRSAWECVGGFPEWLPKFGEDTLFAIRLRVADCKFATARDAMVGWRPKPTLRAMVRQFNYYEEAAGLMGLPPTQAVKVGGRLAALLLASVAIGFESNSGLIALAVFGALLLADFFRVAVLRKLDTPSAYIFWNWALPLMTLVGRARGVAQRRLGRITIPREDRQAIRQYYTRT